MAHDLNPKAGFTVSDIRESILANLKKRFQKAGIKNFKSFVADLTGSPFTPGTHRDLHPPFDLIIADVPCSGSGTWSRTPEQLCFFDLKKINEYTNLQRRIISNIIKCLRPGGYLLYITCSVFKMENEVITDFIQKEFHLQLIKMELLKGYTLKADTLFAALLRLPY